MNGPLIYLQYLKKNAQETYGCAGIVVLTWGCAGDPWRPPPRSSPTTSGTARTPSAPTPGSCSAPRTCRCSGSRAPPAGLCESKTVLIAPLLACVRVKVLIAPLLACVRVKVLIAPLLACVRVKQCE